MNIEYPKYIRSFKKLRYFEEQISLINRDLMIIWRHEKDNLN